MSASLLHVSWPFYLPSTRFNVSVDIRAANTTTTSAAVRGLTNGVNQATHDRRWYEKMRSVGLVYGPTFKTLSNIRTVPNLDGSLADVALQATKGTLLQESWYPVHPTAIDGCLQLSIIAAHGGDPDALKKAYLPVAIEHMTVSTASSDASSAAIRGNGTPRGLRSFRTNFELWESSGSILVQAQLSFMSLEGSINSQIEAQVPQPYTRLVWKPDVDRLPNAKLESMLTDTDKTQNSEVLFGKLEEVTSLSIIDSVLRLPGDLDVASLPEHVQKFVTWLKAEGKNLSATELGALSASDRKARIEAITAEISHDVPEAAMVARLNTYMPDIVAGNIGTLDVMIKDDLMTRIYEEGFGQVGAYAKLEKVVELIAHKEPRLNILELGSGTGGATRPMLAALRGKHAVPNYRKYHFTDVSTAFLSAAQEAFKDYHNLEFNLLDIEKDPTAQGFEEGSFDIVFASNVIHATRNVTESLRNCKKLLRPEGRLIIVETTVDRLVTGFMLGTLPGYWLGAEDGRPNSPFLSTEAWSERLRDAGLSGTDILLHDYPEPNNCTTLMVSRNSSSADISGDANSHDAAGETQEEDPVWLLYRETCPPLLSRIESLYASLSIQTRRASFLEFPTAVSPRKNIRSIMLAELESPLLSRMSEADMAAMQALTQLAATTVWVTNGDVLSGRDPEKCLVFGLAKSIMTEQPSFHLATVDVDSDDIERSARVVVDMEREFHRDPSGDMDKELVVKDGVVYISRYIADDAENLNFAKTWRPKPEGALVRDGLEMAFEKVGKLDSYYFRQAEPVEVAETEVLIEARAFGFDKEVRNSAYGRSTATFHF